MHLHPLGIDASLLGRLPLAARRGSKPRCHALTHGADAEVASRLSKLCGGWASVSVEDAWMPVGFEQRAEAQLHNATRLLDPKISRLLQDWWLPPGTDGTTPNFDIASTCRIDGKKGLLLVEAKAHLKELTEAEAGRVLVEDDDARRASHPTIGRAIKEAADGLGRDTRLACRLSRDNRYQMSNRFAWSWKLATLGVPVVLVYLGFLRALDMADRGPLFSVPEDWERAVRVHSKDIIDDAVWNARWMIDGKAPLIPLLVSLQWPA